MEETRVSGNIFCRQDKHHREGEVYVIRNPVTGHGWGLPVDGLNPDDLRALADRIEEKRSRIRIVSRMIGIGF